MECFSRAQVMERNDDGRHRIDQRKRVRGDPDVAETVAIRHHPAGHRTDRNRGARKSVERACSASGKTIPTTDGDRVEEEPGPRGEIGGPIPADAFLADAEALRRTGPILDWTNRTRTGATADVR